MTRWLLVALFLVGITCAVHAQRAHQPELVLAAEAGDANKVKELMDAGADPNLPKRFSALEAACAGAFPSVVAEMLRPHTNGKAADLKRRDLAGRMPLHLVGATAVEDTRVNAADVARLLIASGADVNAQDEVYGNTLLHQVPDAATAVVLLKAGAQINLRNKERQTPLMLTLDEEVTRVLVEAGADLSLRDKQGKTALDLARELELTEKIAVLERGKK